jgi:hypothetical protein
MEGAKPAYGLPSAQQRVAATPKWSEAQGSVHARPGVLRKLLCGEESRVGSARECIQVFRKVKAWIPGPEKLIRDSNDYPGPSAADFRHSEDRCRFHFHHQHAALSMTLDGTSCLAKQCVHCPGAASSKRETHLPRCLD